MRCRQCGKDDLPLNQQSGLCVRCAIDNEVAKKTVDCIVCKQRKLMLIPISDLSQYKPVGKIRGILIYTGVCELCKVKQEASHE